MIKTYWFCVQKWVTKLSTHLEVSLLCLLPWFHHVKHIPAYLYNTKTFPILTAPGFIWCIHTMMLRIWTWSLKDIIHRVKGSIKSVWLSMQLIVANTNIIYVYIYIYTSTSNPHRMKCVNPHAGLIQIKIDLTTA